jgi:hypothetical protein
MKQTEKIYERTVSAKRSRKLSKRGVHMEFIGSTINGKARYIRIKARSAIRAVEG